VNAAGAQRSGAVVASASPGNIDHCNERKVVELMTKDPMCGMNVDEATAVHADRDGKTFYFCSDSCRQKFMSSSAHEKPKDTSRGCCS
jgi:YHS domain-containing protein